MRQLESMADLCRRRDLRLVEVAMKRGADVFVRDKRGKRVLEGEKGADERIKVFLRQCKPTYPVSMRLLTIRQQPGQPCPGEERWTATRFAWLPKQVGQLQERLADEVVCAGEWGLELL